MRLLLCSLAFCYALTSYSQAYFPVKIQNRWGLIDSEGHLVVEPRYEAIGSFKQFGYAVMQRGGRVGLMNQNGEEVVSPAYDDLKVLDSVLVAVLEDRQWKVIDLDGNTILDRGYERVVVWEEGGYLSYRRAGKWGLVDKSGREIAPPVYEDIRPEKGDCFRIIKEHLLGVIRADGQILLPPEAEAIDVLNDSLILFQKDRKWGGIDQKGRLLFEPEFKAYYALSEDYLQLVRPASLALFSLPCKSVIADQQFEAYHPLNQDYIMGQKGDRVGLIDWCGDRILPPMYEEVQLFSDQLFRVRLDDRWLVVHKGGQPVSGTTYSYIAPLRKGFSRIRHTEKFGLLNSLGEEVLPAEYHRLEWSEGQVKGIRLESEKEQLTLFEKGPNGALQEAGQLGRHLRLKVLPDQPTSEEVHYTLDKFEWFYETKESRWGLRRIADGKEQIPPTFDRIRVDVRLDLSLVGMRSSGDYDYERTTFRFNFVYGLVNNEIGSLVTDMIYWDIRFDDFVEGNPLARCLLNNGRYGLLDRKGRQIANDYTFIGPFKDGRARMSRLGVLSGHMEADLHLGLLSDYHASLLARPYLLDYTQYDELFAREAYLVCKGCEWGYLDQDGSVAIPPAYDHAKDFVNEVGIINEAGKWGVVGRSGRLLIPPRYDQVHFLENTDNRIIRLYVERPKYGLIDTLGQLTVQPNYDEIGSLREGRLVVMRDNFWGFANTEGLEVIPCRFLEVRPFSEGLAAARIGKKWGFIDKLGQVVIPFEYDQTGDFRNNLVWVASARETVYIDREGHIALAGPFEEATDFFRGVARVRQGGSFGLIDTSGTFIVKPKYKSISPFDEHGLAIVDLGRRRSSYGLIRMDGQLLTSEAFESIEAFSEGLAVVKKDGKYGFIDTAGRLVISLDYARAESFSEGRAAVYRAGDCGYIICTGQAISDFHFSRCLPYSDGKAIVYKGLRRAGLLNTEGELVLEPSVDRLLDFNEGLGLVRDRRYRFYYITEKADVHHGFYEQATGFQNGVAVVQQDGKWGVINRRGIELVPPKYSHIDPFRNGYAKVKVEGFSGLSKLSGELIAEPDYELISYAGEGLFRVEQGDKVGYFDVDGEWVWNLSN